MVVIFLCNGTVFASNETNSTKTGATIIAEVRYRLNETTPSYWADSELLIHVNNAIRDIIAISGCSEVSIRQILSSGTSEYSITVNYIGVNDVIYQGGETSFKTLTKGQRSQVGRVEGVFDEPEYYYIAPEKVGIYPLKDNENVTVTGNTIYIYIKPYQPDITIDDLIPLPACYNEAVINYVLWRAFPKRNQREESEYNRQEYINNLGICINLDKTPEEIWRIIKPSAGEKTQ